MVTEFCKVWTNTKVEGWEGKVVWDDTIQTTGEAVDEESLQLILDNVPTHDPTKNSRIIFLAAHSQHAYRIMKYAHFALGEKTRRAYLDKAATNHTLTLFYHLPFPSLGYVRRDGDAFKWEPIDS